MTADEAREVLAQVRYFDGEMRTGAPWPATPASVQWLATHLRDALATIIAEDEGVPALVRHQWAAVRGEPEAGQ